MKKYFLVTVKFNRRDTSDDSMKLVTENLLIDAVSFTDAEAQATKHMEGLVKAKECVATFDFTNIAKKEYRDVFYSGDEGDSWFEAKVTHTSFDPDKERDVKTKLTYLVKGYGFDEANLSIVLEMEEIEGGYEKEALTKTKINEVLEKV